MEVSTLWPIGFLLLMFIAFHLLRHRVSEDSAIRDANNWFYCAFFLVYAPGPKSKGVDATVWSRSALVRRSPAPWSRRRRE